MMQRMDLVEKVGSGLKRIRDMCRDYPCAQPIIEADQDWYRFTLMRTAVVEQVDTAPTVVSTGGPIGGPMGGSISGPIPLMERQQEILALIKANNKISYRAIAEQIQINESAVKKHLNALKNKGTLKRMDGTRGYWQVIDENKGRNPQI